MTGRICGTGSYVPVQVWDNKRLSEMVNTSDEWIRSRTGIARRHIAVGEETTVYMAARAGAAALENAGLPPGEIDLILVATMSRDEIMPCVACEVQGILNIPRAVCFDVNAACSGFLFALNTAQAYLSQGIFRNALVIGAEQLSRLTDWSDRSTCILFGDGAGAVVLCAETEGMYVQCSYSEGWKGHSLLCRREAGHQDCLIRMDGGEVFKFAVAKVPEVIQEVLQKASADMEIVDFFILHQANARIIRSVAGRLGADITKFPMNIQEYGNTSAASIPVLLNEVNQKGMLHRGDHLILAGFGGGLSYGAALLEW